MIFIKKILPNLLVLSSIMMIFVFAPTTGKDDIQNIFKIIDDLTTNLILVIVAITIGLLIKQYLYILVGLIAAIAIVILMPTTISTALNLTGEYVLACGLVSLGFSATANIYENYRKFN